MRFAVWSYRAVLRLYPAAFQQEFGADMTQFFADRLREAQRRGGVAVLRCFSRSIYDAVMQAARERLHQRRRVLTLANPATPGHPHRDSPRKRQSAGARPG